MKLEATTWDDDKIVFGEIDKSGWGKGPWQDEPDRIDWIDPETCYPCIIVRHPHFGSLCGYVAVPPGHPLHGVDFNDAPLDAHGSVNYSALCADRVCHVPKPGEPDNVWWFGFDMAHAGDFMPAYALLNRIRGWEELDRGAQYRPIKYVQRECRDLARQLKELEQGEQTV